MNKFKTSLKKFENKLKINTDSNITIIFDDIPYSEDSWDSKTQTDIDLVVETVLPQEMVNQLIKEKDVSNDVLFLDINDIRQLADTLREVRSVTQ